MSDGKKQFDMGDYNDVAHRIAEFREKYPDGSLRPADPAKPYEVRDIAGKTFIVYAAAAYRRPDDTLPGIGLAWEPFPGATPYTRNSELQNAETSAWGRAIMASLAADARKGIASAEEVRNRAEEPPPREESRPAASSPSSRPGSASGTHAGNGARPAHGASEGVPPCDKCGGAGKTNPRHAENEKAPEFQCAGSCTDPSRDGMLAYTHGFYAASEAQLKAVSAALAALGKDMESRGLSKEDVDTRIRDWMEGIGVPRSRKLFSKVHATRALDALKGHEFILDELAPYGREPGDDSDSNEAGY